MCSELLVVAAALLDDRYQSEAGVHVPSSGAAWWRVQLRAEHEARDKARRAVQWTYELSVGAIIVVMVAALAMTSLASEGWRLLTSISLNSPMSLLSATPLPLLVAAIAGFMIVSSLALYLALAGDRQ